MATVADNVIALQAAVAALTANVAALQSSVTTLQSSISSVTIPVVDFAPVLAAIAAVQSDLTPTPPAAPTL